jgi:hypothetical protein
MKSEIIFEKRGRGEARGKSERGRKRRGSRGVKRRGERTKRGFSIFVCFFCCFLYIEFREAKKAEHTHTHTHTHPRKISQRVALSCCVFGSGSVLFSFSRSLLSLKYCCLSFFRVLCWALFLFY